MEKEKTKNTNDYGSFVNILYQFTNRLSKRMEALNLKDREVWDEEKGGIGIDPRTFSGYKHGRNIPPANVIFNLAQKLNCSADYLLGLEDIPTHEATDICEWTGLSNDTVEILHEAKKDDNAGYLLFVDLFEYLLKRYSKYLKLKDEAQAASDSVDTMMLYVSEAMRFNLVKRTQTKETVEMYKEAAAAEAYLSEGGFTVIPVESGYHYALQEASEGFIKLLRQFIREKIDKDPDFAKRIWDPSTFNRSLVDSLFKTTILSSDPSHSEDPRKDTKKEEAHELPVL